MPQGRKTAEEVLGLQPRRPTAEEVLGLPPQRPTAEEVLGLQPQPQEDFLTRLRRNVGIGYQQGKAALSGAVDTVSEATSQALKGNFTPALEALELGARGGLATQAAILTGGNVGAFRTASQTQAPAIERVNAEREARRLAGPDSNYYRGVATERARLEQQAARDLSLFGKVTRGVVSGGVQAIPTIAAGAVTGGSAPVVAGVSALSALGQPETATLAGAASVIPVPSARAIKETVSRVLGRGAAQIVEAEAKQAGGGLIRATGAAVDADAIRASLPSSGLNAAIAQAASQVPESTARRIVGEISAFPRAMMSSLDISAPGRQGLLLSVAPSRWGEAIKAGRRMFQAFKPEAYERITKEIANHADAPLAEKSGLYLAMRQAEEFFTSKLAAKVPGVTRSQRMYETYLDSLRMSTFSQYKRIIDKAGLEPPQATRAYEAAAKWINYATGRGSLGKKFDDAVPLLSQFLFAPRFTASRINVLNPVMYAKNFRDPATRVVAKEQMKDLAQYLGAVATTMGLAKAAGLDVGLNPSKGDFLKIRWGAKTYDPGAGLTQVMRFAIRTSYDLFRAGKGEKAGYNQDALTLSLRFLRSKLAPLPSYAWDFFSRRTYEGKPFVSAKDRAIGVIERTTPLTWSQFVEALWNEGIGGAAATLPGGTGIGVQSYTEPGGALDRMQPLFSEYVRAGRSIPEIRKLKDEPDDQFNARVKVFGEALETYGLGLVGSDEYRQADAATKDRVLDLLPRRISSALMRQGESWQLQPRVLLFDARESIQSEQKREPRRLYNAQGERLR